jgi:hypothetical protein
VAQPGRLFLAPTPAPTPHAPLSSRPIANPFLRSDDLETVNIRSNGKSRLKYSPQGQETTFASDSGGGTLLNQPGGLAFDSNGNLYVVNIDHTIVKYNSAGQGSVFAQYPIDGSQYCGFSSLTVVPDDSFGDSSLLYFQNGTSLGILSLNTTFLPNTWQGVGAMGSGWQERAVADIDGDGVPDIIFQNGTLIGALIMNGDGTPNSWVGIGQMGAGWELRGAAYMTSDGNLDLIFQNGTLIGYLEIDSSGQPLSWNGIGAMGAGWQLRAVNYLDPNGNTDLVFQNGTLIGDLQVNPNGVPTAWTGIGAMGAGWTLSYALDVTGTGQPSLIFQNGTSIGALEVNTSFQPTAWHGIGAMGSGWTQPGDY